ncbi:phage virion morphogenesis protein [Vibrio coralliilyticus]|uniref:phage virion morphogenesis protein n=1 Tax=Vibrio coralliilyticus TaxID=190893 RepID=UPI0002D2B9D0|nr:phage virion morphogenesis protein [Vibrio coralliilyticus]
MKTLESPEQLTQLVDTLVVKASEKHDLNRRMANRARQFFRQQIRAQRDINNNPYQSRRPKTQLDDGANNKDMLLGFAQALRTRASDKGFEVGLTGSAGVIGREHNEGAQLSFTTRVNGFFDSKVGQWQGGIITKRSYHMPKRTFIGWTPQLEKELLAMAAEHFALEDAT